MEMGIRHTVGLRPKEVGRRNAEVGNKNDREMGGERDGETRSKPPIPLPLFI
jgi:hypothetical protein